jgi:hypothetical protein
MTMRNAANVPKSRLTLELTEAVRQRLEDLRLRTQADSLTEVIRRALAVYDHLWTVKEQGGTIQVKDAEGLKELLLF